MADDKSRSLYAVLHDMAVTFQFQPGVRINEVELARRLSVSRTPLRETLQRLVSEGFLVVQPNKGFFCRDLDPRQIYDLYELRRGLEAFSVRLACERASDKDLKELDRFLAQTANAPDDENIERVLYYDENFHETIARFSGNGELLRSLKNINSRIYFVRWVAMSGQRATTQREHREILRALEARDEQRAADLMGEHILHRKDQILAAIREGFSRIYMGELPMPYHGKPSDHAA
jgi:DNA-binding GntR family transcriptional regulator